jgi:hypothetical protein
MKLTERLMLFLQWVATLHSFIVFKKYTTNQNGKDYAFKDFSLDCVQKMTELAQREEENDGMGDESLASNINSTDTATMQITTSD